MTKLSDDKFYNTYRSTAFMRLIRFCLERHLFDVALALHDRMLKEGFLAVHALSLRMAALNVVRKATNLKGIVPSLKTLLEKKAYDDQLRDDLQERTRPLPNGDFEAIRHGGLQRGYEALCSFDEGRIP
ncbi:hypothetical protein EV363DRAFT_1234911 [Boletus edulis]|uniref:Uncharacterized protein n=1 Tax=Boletus edulis BED1 TaxID=1328754 RepID=A0AAD4BCJ6_BOLED|nr:hypothetical protein EV363DRAFT_1234911 [Boletus edulis]KAF8417755.1 hypothetical protein L210DRAFT_3655968 [Boletus edulis BED1]